jgi:hypothetical protein
VDKGIRGFWSRDEGKRIELRSMDSRGRLSLHEQAESMQEIATVNFRLLWLLIRCKGCAKISPRLERQALNELGDFKNAVDSTRF